jgi:nitric oxide reductase NorQ protein
MKELKQSTKQRFVGMDFDYAPTSVEEGIVEREAGIDADTAKKLVQIGKVARNLKGHGLDEGISTRLLVYAANLINQDITPANACRMALVRPITDDADIRQTLEHAIDTIFV